MPDVWQLHVYTPAGAKRATITPEDAVAEIRWAKRGDGDCLEATIIGKGLPIYPRDVVAIVTEYDETSVGLALVRYWGWCVQAGNPRATDLSTWRLMGGSSRLREIANRNGGVPGNDIGLMAREALLDVNTASPLARVGLVHHRDSGDDSRFPVQGFEAGPRSPNLETLGETLDALAELVPGFTVPPGESYTIDGRTYLAGETVPPTTWGVAAGQLEAPASIAFDPHSNTYEGGLIFFKRAAGTLALQEVALGMTPFIEWGEAIAEVVVDSVAVVIATAPTEGAVEIRSGLISENTPYEPVAYLLEDAFGQALDAWAVVEAANLDALEPAALIDSPASLNMTNASNAFDGNEATYASNAESFQHYVRHKAEGDTCAVRIRYSSHVGLDATFSYLAGFGIGSDMRYRWRLDPTDGEQREVVLVAPRLRNAGRNVEVGVAYASPPFTFGVDDPNIAADAFRVYTIEPLKINEEVCDGIARSQLKPPPEAVATIELPGVIQEPQPRVSITLTSGDVVEAPLGSAEYAITSEGGLATLLRLTHELPPDLKAERDLLERRTRRRTVLRPLGGQGARP